jgi:hypothetical protein
LRALARLSPFSRAAGNSFHIKVACIVIRVQRNEQLMRKRKGENAG